MTDDQQHQCQLYIVTPPRIAEGSFADQLALLLDTVDVAAVRLSLESLDEDVIAASADRIRGTCHSRDVPLIIGEHFRVVRALGLDGVHLMGTKNVRAARKEIGANASIGAYCGVSRHAGMTAGEMGADYISFGPTQPTGLGDEDCLEIETLEWWSEMIEVPSVVEGGLTPEIAEKISPFADFIALGPELWSGQEPPVEILKSYRNLIFTS